MDIYEESQVKLEEIEQEEQPLTQSVIADDDVFVLARPQIRKIPMEDGVEIVGYKRENCKVYDNNVETFNKYNFEVLV